MKRKKEQKDEYVLKYFDTHHRNDSHVRLRVASDEEAKMSARKIYDALKVTGANREMLASFVLYRKINGW